MNVKKILKNIMVIAGGHVFSYAISFLRNVILARMLTKSDFGLASVFALAVSMIDISGRLGLGRQVVQSKEGESSHFLNTAHAFQFMAGVVSAALLVLLCAPMAYFLKTPDITWAYAILGFIPFLKGLENLDFQRRQRQYEFMPSVWVELVPQIIVTALAFPLVKWIGDFRAVLILIISKSLLTTVMTHVMAMRPYRWGWDKKFADEMWRFSWPLILNGLLMYASQQGDRLLVGSGFSLDVLALYSCSAMFIMVPFSLMAHVSGILILPSLARVQNDQESFTRAYMACLEISAVIAVITMIPLMVGGEQIVKLIYGERYSNGGNIMAWLSVACAFRFLRIIPATAAMAMADTKNNLLTNIFRSLSLGLGVIVIIVKGSVEALASCMFIGEFVAMIGSAWLLKRNLKISTAGAIKATLYVLICLSIPGSLVLIGSTKWNLSLLLPATMFLITISIVLARWAFPENSLYFLKQIKVKFKLPL